MFNLSGSEIVVILLLALVVLGPEKLPDAMRRAGRAYSEFRRMSTTFQREMRDAMDEPMREMQATADLIRESARFDADAVEAAGASAPTGAVRTEPEPSEPAVSDAASDEPPSPESPSPGPGDR